MCVCVCVVVQWKSLLPQLFALDQGLEGLEVLRSGGKPYNLTVYNNIDKHCAGIIYLCLNQLYIGFSVVFWNGNIVLYVTYNIHT